MGVKFFGQFLIDQGEVDASDVREALELMDRENTTIGELAMRQGYLKPEQAARVNAEQRSRDLSFGDLAVEMGFLTPEQLVDVLRRQRSLRLPIGQALVKLGKLQADRLGGLLDAYKTDQADYEVRDVKLPDALAAVRVSRYVVEFLPRFLMRVARIHAKSGEVRPFESVPDFARVSVSVMLQGTRGLEVVLVSDRDFAQALASATSGLGPDALDDELVADGVGEFLNVLAGNAAGATAKEGHPMEIGPPDYEATPSHGWILELAVGTGHAALILSPF